MAYRQQQHLQQYAILFLRPGEELQPTLLSALSGNDSKREGITRCNQRPNAGFIYGLREPVAQLWHQKPIGINMSGLAINPKGVQFDPDTDISALTGKNIFVTGGELDLHVQLQHI